MQGLAFVIRTGGGLREKTFGAFSYGLDSGDEAPANIEDGEEVATDEKATIREARAKAKKLNDTAHLAGQSCRFSVVKARKNTPEYERLYALYLSDTAMNNPALFKDEELSVSVNPVQAKAFCESEDGISDNGYEEGYRW